MARVPGSSVTGDAGGDHPCPADDARSSARVVVTGPEFSTSVATSTTARSASMSGVVTRTPSGTMCAGFFTIRCTSR